jgi:NADH-quinone oxidoreductase subunit H
VAAQTQPIIPQINFPGWYALLLIPSFVIYVIAMVAECNRAPFDLVECEQELVSGFLTDYSGFRYAAFFLAEYINMATVSGVATTLFLGGYHAPWPLNLIPGIDAGWLGLVWFTAKVLVFMYGFVWLRGTLPRLRYDQLMDLGWKWLLPISLGWIVAIGTVNVLRGTVSILVMMGVILLMAVIAVAILSRVIGDDDKESIMPNAPDKKSRVVEVKPGEFDAFAGGYPVPPMPGQVLPELAGVVRGSASDPETASATKEA